MSNLKTAADWERQARDNAAYAVREPDAALAAQARRNAAHCFEQADRVRGAR